jgi:TATA-box binding protein (TBP) (component of TFIID and TFIIIB)
MNDEMKAHNAAVEEMFQQIKPIVESYNSAVALNTLLIVLAACGQQTDLEPEVFKALVVQELDRLMLVNAERKGMLS